MTLYLDSRGGRGVILAVAVAGLLTGCGGGGGGSNVRSTVEFTGAAIQPSTIYSATTTEQTTTYTYNTSTNKVTSISAPSAASSGTGYIGYDANGSPDYMRVVSPGTGIDMTLDQSAGDTFEVYSGVTGSGVVVGYEGSSIEAATEGALLIDDNYDYQSFGYWEYEPTAGTVTSGVYSAGYITPAASVPTSGSATYSGKTIGLYSSAAGDGYITTANVSATADFSNRSINFSTSSTQATSASNSASPPTSMNSLNLSGTLSYNAGSSNFTGAVNTTGGLSGTADGKFYGGLAEEIGGVYGLDGSGLEAMMGSFGAKKL